MKRPGFPGWPWQAYGEGMKRGFPSRVVRAVKMFRHEQPSVRIDRKTFQQGVAEGCRRQAEVDAADVERARELLFVMLAAHSQMPELEANQLAARFLGVAARDFRRGWSREVEEGLRKRCGLPVRRSPAWTLSTGGSEAR